MVAIASRFASVPRPETHESTRIEARFERLKAMRNSELFSCERRNVQQFALGHD
jgi:hypothetical protein